MRFWAAQTVDFTCYDRNTLPRLCMTSCTRQYSWGTATEDYVLPDAHAVHISIAPELVAALPAGECTWTWTPHRSGLAGESRKQPCKDAFVNKWLPYSTDRAALGAAVKVTLLNERELADPAVRGPGSVIIAMGDSFTSARSIVLLSIGGNGVGFSASPCTR